MKKILLISNRVMHYRVSVYNYFVEQFKSNGWEFFVRANELQKQNPHHLMFDFQEYPFNFKIYKDEILKIKPDVVIIFLHLKNKIIWPLVHWLKWKKIPIAFWTKGKNLDEPDKWLSTLIYKYMHRLFDHLILYSSNEKKYIYKKYHNKISIANNTINYNDFPVLNESKQQIKKEFGIPFEKVVLSVGRMGTSGGRKKIDHLIQVFNDLENDNTGLIIVGSGMTDELQKKLNPRNTKYLGEVHDPNNIEISKIFKMADVFSIPGHVGLGLNQAFYWGLPVVTEEGRQPPEIYYLKNGRNGFIVPENDLGQLKDKLLFLINNDDKRKIFSKNAKADILKNASIKNMFNGFRDCVERISR